MRQLKIWVHLRLKKKKKFRYNQCKKLVLNPDLLWTVGVEKICRLADEYGRTACAFCLGQLQWSIVSTET